MTSFIGIEPFSTPLILFTILFILFIPAAFFFSRFFFYILQRYLIKKNMVPSYFNARTHFSKSFFWFLLITGGEFLLFMIPLEDVLKKRIEMVFDIALIIAGVWILSRSISLIKISIYLRLDIARANNLRERKIRTQLQFIEKITLIFLYIIAAALILMNFDQARKLGSSLIASAGLAGVILGFAAQRSLTNIIAGFQIAFTQPIRIDDIVTVENEWGKIEEITLTYVVIRIWDKRALVTPITYFLEKPFQNLTRASSEVIAHIFLYVDYSLPLSPLRNEFERLIKDSPLWDGKISAVHVTNSTERALEVRFLFGTHNPQDAFNLKCFVREQLISFIQREYSHCFPQYRVRYKPVAPGEHVQEKKLCV